MITVNCSVCEIQFETFPYKLKGGGGKYCSKKCCFIGIRRKVSRNCPNCQKEFSVHPSNMRNGKPCCSTSCARRYGWASNRTARFLARILVLPGPNACWIWTGNITGQGYGALLINNKQILAHRFSYEHFREPIPKGMLGCHKCNIPLCVSPHHVYVGDGKSNMRDMLVSGRSRAKLTTIQVQYALASNLTHAKLAVELGVSRTTITELKQGKIYKHIPRP